MSRFTINANDQLDSEYEKIEAIEKLEEKRSQGNIKDIPD